MQKYIKSYSEINESVDRGAIVLIKGKPEGDKKKLYAAHVMSCVTLPQGAMMLFLADEFYRIKEEGKGLKAVKISYKNETALKSALNLKSPGKISIVKNNNKTPLHWKTLKHTSLHSALKEIEDEIRGEQYIFESDESNKIEKHRMWDEFSNLVISRTLSTVFFGDKQIDILSYSLDNEGIYSRIWNSDETELRIEWEIDFKVLLRSSDFKPYIEYFNFEDRVVDVSLFIESSIALAIQYDPGDYWNPPSSESEISSVYTQLEDVLVEGTGADSDEVKPLISKVDEILRKGDMLPDELEQFILNNLKDQILMRKES